MSEQKEPNTKVPGPDKRARYSPILWVFVAIFTVLFALSESNRDSQRREATVEAKNPVTFASKKDEVVALITHSGHDCSAVTGIRKLEHQDVYDVDCLIDLIGPGDARRKFIVWVKSGLVQDATPAPDAGAAGSLVSGAASDADIDKMTTYAAMLGRATACGADTEDAYRSVGAWMTNAFPQSDKANRVHMRIFLDGVVHHAREQKAGNSPDTCSAVLRAMDGFPWP